MNLSQAALALTLAFPTTIYAFAPGAAFTEVRNFHINVPSCGKRLVATELKGRC